MPSTAIALTRQMLKGMGTVDIYAGHSVSAIVLAPATALVTQLQLELHNLLTRNEELRRRIRSVHAVLSGLQEMSNARASDYSGASSVPSQPSFADRTIARSPKRQRRSGALCNSNHVCVSLQRACRIALMETEAAVSLDEIHARIVRRESFSFVKLGSANAALIRVLCAMVRDGEVRLLKDGPCWRWERTWPETGINGGGGGTNAMFLGL